MMFFAVSLLFAILGTIIPTNIRAETESDRIKEALGSGELKQRACNTGICMVNVGDSTVLFQKCLVGVAIFTKIRGEAKKTEAQKPKHRLEGDASWYGPGFQGKKTACGGKFDMYSMTAAHATLPCGTKVRVTNMDNHQSLIVMINDTGPWKNIKKFIRTKRGKKKMVVVPMKDANGKLIPHPTRVIDLAKTPARKIGIDGFAPVKIEVLNN